MSSSISKSAALLASQANCSTAQSVAGLADLLARVEAATGPDRELDGALGFELLLRHEGDFSFEGFSAGGVTYRDRRHRLVDLHWVPPMYTASLDAALALVERVLPDAGWLCGVKSEGGFMAELFRTRYVSGVIPRLSYAAAPTPALALLAALLKALASQQPRDQQVAGDRSRETPLLNTSEADEKR